MKMLNRRHVAVRLGSVVCAGLLLSGCVGYQLGSTLPPGIESIYISAFANETREPQIETAATRAALQEFQRDGTLQVTTEGQADAMLEVTLVGFDLSPLRYQNEQALTTEEYRQTITARIVLTRLKGDREVVLNREVRGEATFDLVGDLSSSKDRALPEAAADLAHDIVESIVEYW